mgnify:CR=1 FL=1
MRIKTFIQKTVLVTSYGLLVTFSASAQTWQGPSGNPPGANKTEPINVGSAIQTKQAGLILVGNLIAQDLQGDKLCLKNTNGTYDCKNAWSQITGSATAPTLLQVLQAGADASAVNTGVKLGGGLSLGGDLSFVDGKSILVNKAAGGSKLYMGNWNGTAWNAFTFSLLGVNSKLSIGTSVAPTYTLEVASPIYALNVGNANSWLKVNTGGNSRLSLGDGAGHEAGFIAGGQNAPTDLIQGNKIIIAGCSDAGSCPGYATFLDNGNVGIGTASPSAKLEVNGQIKITGGSPGAGKVLTSDASGLASWQLAGGSGLTQATADGRYVQKAGDTMTGGLTLSAGNLALSSTSDLFIADTKSIRVDAETESTLNIGNWGGARGSQQPVTLAIVGEGSKITTPEFCFGSDCRTSWATMNLGKNLRYASVSPATITVVNEPSFTSIRIGDSPATSATIGLNVNATSKAILARSNDGIQATAFGLYGTGVTGLASGENGVGVYGLGKTGVSGIANFPGGRALNGFATISDAYAGVFTGGKGVVIQKSGSTGPANLIVKNGGISTFSADENVDAETIEASKFCLGNGTNCITRWPTIVTTGTNNTANGLQALYSNTTGSFNTAVGASALLSNTTGNVNIAVGANALLSNTTGESNTANGFSSLHFNTTGENNTANGFRSLYFNTMGNFNTSIGFYALSSNRTGSGNTAIGKQADVASGDLFNATAIGAEAIVDANNKVRVGNDAVTVIGGKVGWSNLSDIRFKKDIQGSDLGLDFINQLRPVSFRMKDGNGELDYGFIAQEVETALGDRETNMVSTGGGKEKMKSLRYTDLIAPLVKAVQEQQKEIKLLRLEVKSLMK